MKVKKYKDISLDGCSGSIGTINRTRDPTAHITAFGDTRCQKLTLSCFTSVSIGFVVLSFLFSYEFLKKSDRFFTTSMRMF